MHQISRLKPRRQEEYRKDRVLRLLLRSIGFCITFLFLFYWECWYIFYLYHSNQMEKKNHLLCSMTRCLSVSIGFGLSFVASIGSNGFTQTPGTGRTRLFFLLLSSFVPMLVCLPENTHTPHWSPFSHPQASLIGIRQRGEQSGRWGHLVFLIWM